MKLPNSVRVIVLTAGLLGTSTLVLLSASLVIVTFCSLVVVSLAFASALARGRPDAVKPKTRLFGLAAWARSWVIRIGSGASSPRKSVRARGVPSRIWRLAAGKMGEIEPLKIDLCRRC